MTAAHDQETRVRVYDANGFREGNPDAKGYPGFTELLRDGRTYQTRGVGEQVRSVLLRAVVR